MAVVLSFFPLMTGPPMFSVETVSQKSRLFSKQGRAGLIEPTVAIEKCESVGFRDPKPMNEIASNEKVVHTNFCYRLVMFIQLKLSFEEQLAYT